MADWSESQARLVAAMGELKKERNDKADLRGVLSPSRERYSVRVVEDADAQRLSEQMKELRTDSE
jgi:hypothetical protein